MNSDKYFYYEEQRLKAIQKQREENEIEANKTKQKEEDNKEQTNIIYKCENCNLEASTNETKEYSDRPFYNKTLCYKCWNNEWRCNFCKLRTFKNDGHFFNNKCCMLCYKKYLKI